MAPPAPHYPRPTSPIRDNRDCLKQDLYLEDLSTSQHSVTTPKHERVSPCSSGTSLTHLCLRAHFYILKYSRSLFIPCPPQTSPETAFSLPWTRSIESSAPKTLPLYDGYHIGAILGKVSWSTIGFSQPLRSRQYWESLL